MDSIAVIILNYMTWQETLREVEAVRKVLAHHPYEIIVVDNCSPIESARELEQASAGSFTFFASLDRRRPDSSAMDRLKKILAV